MDFKIEKIERVKEIPEIENLAISEIGNNLTYEMASIYDDLMFTMLDNYGINKSNWREQIHRVEAVDVPGAYYSEIKHYFVDGEYAFTIEPEIEFIYEPTYKVTVKYTVKILEHMKGQRTR